MRCLQQRFSGSSDFEELRQQSLGDSRDLAVAAIWRQQRRIVFPVKK